MPPLGTIFDLPTPALLLDRSRLERNATRMRDKVRQLGVTLRPHVKTSKSIEVLRVLADGGDVPITVSTLPEVADLISAGCRLRVILDTLDAAEALRAFVNAQGIAVEPLIEIDSDGHR